MTVTNSAEVYDYFNSPLERIVRKARERRQYVLAHPAEFTRQEVEAAQLREYQDERLSLAATLRYDD